MKEKKEKESELYYQDAVNKSVMDRQPSPTHIDTGLLKQRYWYRAVEIQILPVLGDVDLENIYTAL